MQKQTFSMNGGIKREIQNAINELALTKSDIYLLDDHSAKKVFDDCVSHFLKSGERRWWWEEFKLPTFSLENLDNSFLYITKILPLGGGNVWLIVEEDDEPFYPVYDCNPKIIDQIIGQCYHFEYYIIDKNKEWLLCENHHNRLIAIGDKLKNADVPWQID